jgi:hypothetical protein
MRRSVSSLLVLGPASDHSGLRCLRFAWFWKDSFCHALGNNNAYYWVLFESIIADDIFFNSKLHGGVRGGLYSMQGTRPSLNAYFILFYISLSLATL